MKMDSIELREMEVSLYKWDTYFELALNSDIMSTDIYTEGVKDILSKIRHTILKYAIIFDKYAVNVINTFELYKQKMSVEKNMKVIQKALKKNPDIANKKIKYRIYDNYKNEIDYETNISNNLAFRIENLDEEWLTDIMDAYYKDIDAENHEMEEVTIQEAFDDMQEVLKDIDKAIEKQKKSVKQTCVKLSKSKNLNIKQLSLLKKFLLCSQKHVQNKIFKTSVRLDYLYNELHKATSDTIKEESEKYVKRKYSTEARAEKDAQFIGKVKVLDYDIDLYRTEKYIISEYTRGNCVYFDRDFINLPKSHQAAILAHEYGHIVNGHTLMYDRKLRNEYKLGKDIKKSVKKYDKAVDKSGFGDVKEVADDSLLIYLLVELDADRYAAKTVGREVIKKALLTDYEKMTKNLNMSDLEKEYYMFIAKTRTDMI